MKTRLEIQIEEPLSLKLTGKNDYIEKREGIIAAIAIDMRNGRNSGRMRIRDAIVNWSIWKQTEG